MTHIPNHPSAQEPHPAFDRDKLVERITKIYRRYARGLWKPTTQVSYIDAFDSMLERYLNHHFHRYGSYDEFEQCADFTKAAICSALQPRGRYYICVALEDLLIELDLEDISYGDLHNALYTPIWRIEDERHHSMWVR